MKIAFAIVLALTSAAAVAQSGEGVSAKALFFGTDGNVMSVATAPAPSTTVAKKPEAKKPAATKVASGATRPQHLGASYFIRLKNDNGTTQDVLTSRVFKSGERFQLGVKVNQPAYVYIYNRDEAGRLTKLYPQPGQSNFVNAMGVVFFPAQGSFQFDQSPGEEQLLVYMSPKEIDGLEGRLMQTTPDLVAGPTKVVASDAGCSPVVQPTTAQTPEKTTLADAGAAVSSKGINYAAADANCPTAATLASKAIVFSDDPKPVAGGQVASYVVKHQSTPTDSLHLQLKLQHR